MKFKAQELQGFFERDVEHFREHWQFYWKGFQHTPLWEGLKKIDPSGYFRANGTYDYVRFSNDLKVAESLHIENTFSLEIPPAGFLRWGARAELALSMGKLERYQHWSMRFRLAADRSLMSRIAELGNQHLRKHIASQGGRAKRIKSDPNYEVDFAEIEAEYWAWKHRRGIYTPRKNKEFFLKRMADEFGRTENQINRYITKILDEEKKRSAKH